VVAECQRLGILVDLAHLNPAGVDELLAESSGPLIISHTTPRTFYDIERNSSDEHIRAVGQRGGVVGANAVLVSPRAEDSTLDRYADEIEYLVELAGIDGVGLGFDFFEFIYFEMTLQRPWPRLDLFRPRPTQTLPIILSVDEVWRILSQLDHPTYYTCLATIYTCGLRISEGVNLQVSWIDSARMQLQIRGGKGEKDRYIPLPARTLTLLRRQWLTHRNPVWLFPAGAGARKDPHTATVPITSTSVRRAFQQARLAAGLTKQACVHSLRHS
jgi:integrase